MTDPSRFKALMGTKPTRATNSAMSKFLAKVWDYKHSASTFLYTRRAGTDHMVRHRIRGDRELKITKVLDAQPPEEHDVFFCPNAFNGPSNRKVWALPTRYAWSDIDDADPEGFDPKPNALWETSKGRYQGLWIWPKQYPAEDAQQFCRNLWLHFGGDKGAWSANKLLRVPGTTNHKRSRHQAFVRLLRFDPEPQTITKEVADLSRMHMRSSSADSIDPYVHDPEKVMQKYGPKIGQYAKYHMRTDRLRADDRSGKVYLIVRKLMSAGASDDEVASVLRVNVYFTDKWGDDLCELERQIIKIRGDWEADQ